MTGMFSLTYMFAIGSYLEPNISSKCNLTVKRPKVLHLGKLQYTTSFISIMRHGKSDKWDKKWYYELFPNETILNVIYPNIKILK
jgi:hypothetical protein